MSTYSVLTEKAGDQLLDGLQLSERVVAPLAKAVNDVLAQLPSLPSALAERLPSRVEVVTANYALLERLVGAYKEFALRLVTSGGDADESDRGTAQARTIRAS